MLTLTYPLTDAITAANAVLPHLDGPKTTTPILSAACLTAGAWTGTDRYTVGRYTLDGEEGGEATEAEAAAWAGHSLTEAAILLPREAVEWVAKIMTKSLRHSQPGAPYSLRISAELLSETNAYSGWDVTVAILAEGGKVERSQSFYGPHGNFPPVAKLIDGFTPGDDGATFRIVPEYFERVTGFAKRHHKGEPITTTMGAGERAPIMMTIGALSVLAQPRLDA